MSDAPTIRAEPAPVIRTALALIDVEDRLRPEDPAWVEIIAASMAERGLIEDVELRPHPRAAGRYLLTAGLHRLRAAERLGWTTIGAKIVERTAAEARLVEIDENLMRRELGALDRALFLAERKKVWEEMYPQTAHGGDRKSLSSKGRNQVANLATRFSREVLERTGLSERTVRRSVALVADLSPEVIALARKSYLADHAADLAALAELAPDEQLAAVRRLAAGEVRRLSALREETVLPADERQLKALLDAWDRAGAGARKRFLKKIDAQPRHKATPAERAAFDAEIAALDAEDAA
jgi:ParB family chromosome partitioning protein